MYNDSSGEVPGVTARDLNSGPGGKMMASESLQKKILVILGTRPEAIKLAPVIRELRRLPRTFQTIICNTAQHREMLDPLLALFDVRPDYDLNIMRPGQKLAQITVNGLRGLDRVIARETPDAILVQGDTTTALCGALAGFYHKVLIGHVEAGLRTSDKYAPFPEEINRRLISQLTDYHFAPTEKAREALLKEGVPENRIFVTGNTVIDALLWVRKKNERNRPKLPDGLSEAIRRRRLVLVTGHRRESFGKGFKNICLAILEVADRFRDVVFVYPVHLNPNVRGPVYSILGRHPQIRLVEPLDYAPFVWLMAKSTLILTDSGGVQEEGPTLGKPVLVMRETTERPEGLAAGNARLVGVEKRKIVENLIELLINASLRKAMSSAQNPYGDGHAAKRIVRALSRM